MIPLREYRPGDREHYAWVEDVRRVLREIEGESVRLRYLASRAPIEVSTTLLAKPVEVTVRTAANRATGVVESGLRVSWTWGNGKIKISALDVSDTAEEYDVVLLLRKV